MAFKGNTFALLNDEDDGDGSQLLPPDLPPSAPESRKPAGHNNVKSERRKGKQTGRGGRERGSVRNNNAQEKGMQNNNYHHSNDNRRYDGHSDRYRQHGRRAYGDQQQNMGDNGYRKNDVHEQNNVDSGDRKGNRGGNRGYWNKDYKFVRRGNGEVKTHEGKEAVGGDEEPKKGNLIAEVSKEREPKQIPNGNNPGKGFSEQKRQDNTMTLQQYDKQLLEKRKALEAFKKEERKVTLDKELDSIQLVGKKKDDVASASAKQNSETEKLKKDDGLGMNEKVPWVIGRHAIFDKDPRVPLAYRRYMRPATTTKDEAPKAGHSHEIPDEAPTTGYSPKVPSKALESGNSHRNPSEAPVKTPDVEDHQQFPVLERVSKKFQHLLA